MKQDLSELSEGDQVSGLMADHGVRDVTVVSVTRWHCGEITQRNYRVLLPGKLLAADGDTLSEAVEKLSNRPQLKLVTPSVL